MNLSEIGEFGFIDTIKGKCRHDPGLLLGIGDDTAAMIMTPGMALLSTSDLLAEGVHFNTDWSEPTSLGRKSLAVNLSDIAAMGGIPRYALLSLAVPPTLNLEFMNSFITGFLEQAEKFAVILVGGDTSAAKDSLFISVTMLGEQYPERISRRSGAGSGDLVCVSGTLGDSALGLKRLKAGLRTGHCIDRHLDPTPRVALGKTLAEKAIPSAMIDISDGLCADLGHILAASGKGAKICIDDLPLSDEFRTLTATDSPDYYNLPLSGGEDYELLFTLNPSKIKAAEAAARETGTVVAIIGEITAETGLFLAKSDGSSFETPYPGYNHFARN